MTASTPVIRLRNSMTGTKEDFEPLDPANVRMYVCGPTVYDRAHLGNARPVVVFDVLYRLLRHAYGADHVTYVRNFTDVDDKINAEALRRRQAGAEGTLEELIRQRTEETIAWYHEDMDALGALRPSIRGNESPEAEPRATEWIGAMIAMIEDLVAKGHAYAAEGHVLFRVRSYAEYGALSGRTLDDMIAGARVEVAPFKEDPLDFVLWKPSDDELPGWDSPWGRGRPGWHIECSAMSRELLGASFDIHGGGIDLQFPHHENEIAQSHCAHPGEGFAKYWLHNEMVMVDGKKMSKSLGNFFTVHDLLEQGVPGEVIRLVLLMTHYRSPMDWTAEKAITAQDTLEDWYQEIEGVSDNSQPADEILATLSDDLNTPEAISVLHKLSAQGRFAELKASARLLGLFHHWKKPELTKQNIMLVESLMDERALARKEKDWEKSDRIRDMLQSAGIRVMDSSDGATWSFERDVRDTWPYHERIRLAYSTGDEAELEAARLDAAAAGVHFSGDITADTSPSWVYYPTNKFVNMKLKESLAEIEALK